MARLLGRGAQARVVEPLGLVTPCTNSLVLDQSCVYSCVVYYCNCWRLKLEGLLVSKWMRLNLADFSLPISTVC